MTVTVRLDSREYSLVVAARDLMNARREMRRLAARRGRRRGLAAERRAAVRELAAARVAWRRATKLLGL